MTDKTVEENALSSVINLSRKYPKVSWALALLAVTTFIGNNATSLFQKLGLFGPEVVKVVNPTNLP